MFYHWHGDAQEPAELQLGPLFVVAFDSWARFRRDLSFWRLQNSAEFGLVERDWRNDKEIHGRFDRPRGYTRKRFLYRLRRLQRKPHPQFGPEYPDLGGAVAKYRRNNDPRYGEALSKALRSLQRKELVKGLPQPEPLPPIYRGSEKQRAKFFREQSRRAAIARLTKDLPKRTPEQEKKVYKAAMRAKREAEQKAKRKVDIFA